MKYAIIAAGEGSRLAQEGIKEPKPLVKVQDEHLIDRLIRIFMKYQADEIVVICNDLTALVSSHLAEIKANGLNGTPIPLRFIVKSTPSSMHSFFELSRYLEDSPFVLTTVDTIFREDEFGAYLNAFQNQIGEIDGLMGVTDYIEDEKPLYVGTDDDLNITGFYDENIHCTFISGGIYGLTPPAIKTLRACMERGESRMRNFQRALIRDRLRIKAYPFSKVLDIDHASDILVANEFLNKQ
jgi:NDP-sugar pyrophosphorylase family protein